MNDSHSIRDPTNDSGHGNTIDFFAALVIAKIEIHL